MNPQRQRDLEREAAAQIPFEEAIGDRIREEGYLEPVLAEHTFEGCHTVYAPEPIKPVRVEASSALSEGRVTHEAARAFDGDPATAWVEGVPGDGVEEGLLVWLDEVSYALSIVPGYAKDERRWRENNRVQQLLIRWLKPKIGVEKPRGELERDDLAYSSHMVTVMARRDGVLPFGETQYINFTDGWVGDMSSHEVVALELQIVEVDDEGARYDDTAISEITLLKKGAKLGDWCRADYCEDRGKVGEMEGCPRDRSKLPLFPGKK